MAAAAPAALPAFIGLAATGGLLSASGQYAQGRIAKEESKTESALIGLQAKQRELDRTQRLNEAIASQVTRASASGLQLAGTPIETMEAITERSEREQAAEDVGARITQRMIRSRGNQAEIRGRLGAATSLISSGTQMAGAFV